MTGLAFRHVSHRYGDVAALTELTFDIDDGEVCCLIGPSGCGKTTALRIAAGLETLQEGEVQIGDRIVAGPGIHVPPEKRCVGLVFQDFALFPHMTVADNVAFGLRGRDSATRQRLVGEYLDLVGLDGYADKYPHMLSGGEQQRVALARALAPQPGVILLDEPFSGLDVRLREEVREETLAILRRAGATALVVTHDAEEAMYMGDRIALLHDGHLVQLGPPHDVYRQPNSAFVAKFLGDVNWLHGIVTDGIASSAVGPVAAAGMSNGERVDVLIRPEGLHLCREAGAGGCEARVVSNHLLGHSSLVILKLDEGQEVRARIAGDKPPAPGDDVRIRINDDAVFVFPCAVQETQNAG
ncbi:MAG: ABC transporter ATP-binding protein [Pseudomonadota bacterium]